MIFRENLTENVISINNSEYQVDCTVAKSDPCQIDIPFTSSPSVRILPCQPDLTTTKVLLCKLVSLYSEINIDHSVTYPRYQAIATYCISHTFDCVVQQQTIVVVLIYDRIRIDHCISPALHPVKKIYTITSQSI